MYQVLGCIVEVIHAGYFDYVVVPRVDIEDTEAVIYVWFNRYQNIAPPKLVHGVRRLQGGIEIHTTDPTKR